MRGHAMGEFRGSVLIADDHAVFRLGLAQLLQRDLGVRRIVEADRFEEAVEHLQELDLRLVIIDLAMPGLSGPKDIARVRALRPDVYVIVLSASDSRKDILDALSVGVHGYIVKSEPTEALIGRLRYVLSGEIYVPPHLAEQPGEPTRSDEPKGEVKRDQKVLSSRQRQVLKGLVEGRSNKEIAKELEVAEGTVKMHIAALFRVLGATNRAHAAALGKQLVG